MNKSINRWVSRVTLWQIAAVAVPTALMPAAYYAVCRFREHIPARFTQDVLDACDLAGMIVLATAAGLLIGFWTAQFRYHARIRKLAGELIPGGRRSRFHLLRRCGWFAMGMAAVYYAAGTAAVILLFTPTPLWPTVVAAAVWLAVGIAVRHRLAREQGFAGHGFPTGTRIAAGALVLLPLLSWGAMWTATWHCRARAAESLEAIYADEGGFIPFTEMERYLPPLTEDGAEFFYRCDDWVQAHPEALQALEAWQQSRSGLPADAELEAAALAAYAEILPVIDRLGEFRQTRFRRDWNRMPYSITMPELSRMRNLALLQELRIDAAGRAGDGEQAMRLWRHIGNFRSQLAGDPFLICNLVAFAIETIRVRTFMAYLNRHPAPEEWLREVIAGAPAAEAELRAANRRAYHTEIASNLAVDWPLMLTQGDFDKQFLYSRLYTKSASFRHWLAAVNVDAYLEFMAQVYPTGGLDRFQVDRATFESLSAAPEGLMYWIAEMISPGGNHTLNSCSSAYARIRAAAIMAALELHRDRYGDYPETLEALVPEFLPQVPADPFDGEAMRYEIRDLDGRRVLLVYSVGDGTSRSRDIDHSSFPGLVRELNGGSPQ